MGCGVYYQQLREVERALGTLRKFGISELDPAFRVLQGQRGKLLAQIGFKFPRSILQLAKLIGLSPGTVTLWEDAESGFMAEARERPGAPPVYKAVSDEIAAKIIKGELSHDEFELLKVPAVDIDN